MPAPLRIVLTTDEDLTLSELRQAQCVPQRTRDRAHMLRLNARGWNVPKTIVGNEREKVTRESKTL